MVFPPSKTNPANATALIILLGSLWTAANYGSSSNRLNYVCPKQIRSPTSTARSQLNYLNYPNFYMHIAQQ